MTTTFIATAQPDQFTSFHFSQYVFLHRGLFGLAVNPGSDANDGDANEPYNGIVEGFNSSASALALFNQLDSDLLAVAQSFPPQQGLFASDVTDYFELFDDTAVDYSFSNAAI